MLWICNQASLHWIRSELHSLYYRDASCIHDVLLAQINQPQWGLINSFQRETVDFLRVPFLGFHTNSPPNLSKKVRFTLWGYSNLGSQHPSDNQIFWKQQEGKNCWGCRTRGWFSAMSCTLCGPGLCISGNHIPVHRAALASLLLLPWLWQSDGKSPAVFCCREALLCPQAGLAAPCNGAPERSLQGCTFNADLHSIPKNESKHLFCFCFSPHSCSAQPELKDRLGQGLFLCYMGQVLRLTRGFLKGWE